MHKKSTNQGQQFFNEVERAVDAFAEEAKRPAGMPPLAAIKTEIKRLGLPESDAGYIFDKWMASGFKDGCNRRVKDWRAAIRNFVRCGYLPSQRFKPSQSNQKGEEMTNSLLDTLAASPAWKKIDVHQAAWDFKKWCDENNRRPLVASFIKFLSAKL